MLFLVFLCFFVDLAHCAENQLKIEIAVFDQAGEENACSIIKKLMDTHSVSPIQIDGGKSVIDFNVASSGCEDLELLPTQTQAYGNSNGLAVEGQTTSGDEGDQTTAVPLASGAAVLSLFSLYFGNGYFVMPVILVSFLVSVVSVAWAQVPSSAAALLTKSYENCMLLDREINFRLHWTVDNDQLRVGLTSDIQQGWMALGVSADGSMNSGGPGTDIFHGWVEQANGAVHVNDMYTTKYDLPLMDPGSQSLSGAAGASSAAGTALEFMRPLAAQTAGGEDRAINIQEQWFLYAANNVNEPVSDAVFGRHTHYGPVKISLTDGSQCASSLDDLKSFVITVAVNQETDVNMEQVRVDLAALAMGSVERFSVLGTEFQEAAFCPECTRLDLTVDQYAVPAATTTYTCASFLLDIDQQRDIVRFEILKDNEQVLHHIVVFESLGDASSYLTPRECNGMPLKTSPLWAWAPGGHHTDTPPSVGFRVGPGQDTAKWIILQYHYDNPTGSSGFKDSSGIRLYLSPTLRQERAGLVFLGVFGGGIQIPPGRSKYHLSGVCQVPSGLQLNVFSYAWHMHYLGREMWTEIFPAGAGTSPPRSSFLGEPDLYFDFAAQKFHDFDPPLQLKGGETLVTHGVYDSSSKTGMTYGGDETSEEMLLAVLLVYPKPPAAFCLSAPIESQTCDCNFADGQGSCEAPCNGGVPLPPRCLTYESCGACSAAANADPSCGWCSSSAVQVCVEAGVKSDCEGIGGTWHDDNDGQAAQCSAAAGTPCHSHANCASCDQAGCVWCLTQSDGSGFCFDGGNQQLANTICTVPLFNGLLDVGCTLTESSISQQ